MTVTNGLFTLINVDAAMPLRMGRCMSMITTAGLRLAARQDSFLAIDGFPDDPEVVIVFDQFTQKPAEREDGHRREESLLAENATARCLR